MIYIGIDQSMTFTGVTIYHPGAGSEHIFYGITHKKHTKWDKLISSGKHGTGSYRMTVVDTVWLDKDDDYAINERNKFANIRGIVSEIRNIIESVQDEFEDDIEVRMEGISFGSKQTTAIADLAGLNYMIRDVCASLQIPFTILPPTKIKKFATGNGQADKELMTESFLQLNPDMREVHKVIKLDDVADSFFMATYQE